MFGTVSRTANQSIGNQHTLTHLRSRRRRRIHEMKEWKLFGWQRSLQMALDANNGHCLLMGTEIRKTLLRAKQNKWHRRWPLFRTKAIRASTTH